eukprot:2002519-Rhodomonas_salina.1
MGLRGRAARTDMAYACADMTCTDMAYAGHAIPPLGRHARAARRLESTEHPGEGRTHVQCSAERTLLAMAS